MESQRDDVRFAVGRTIDRYRIVERLGAGGIGEVYRARDERLDRDVALKVLRAAGRGSGERERLRREARTLSQLSHAGISTVFDVESSGDVDFIVMELVSGEPLDALLRRGRLDESSVRSYGKQMAEALAAAHERGVVHRDLKPANVMIDGKGRVKLLDFGLALFCPSAAPATDTTRDALSGSIVGTLPYMSPEQLLGRPVDERTDLYALGVVLYEMATGRRPFEAEPATALINEALNALPAPARSLVPSLSGDLSALIDALLAKDPARRPPSAASVAEALGGAASVAVARDGRGGAGPDGLAAAADARTTTIRSIAVLPLANLTGSADQEFFVDGMTEALIASLAQLRALRVVSRTSIMRYKDARLSLPEIARALDVDAVVEGSVSRSADRVRVTAQLIEARADRHLWARSYERDARDVLALQSELARAIADEIQIQVTHEERARLARPRRVDPEAYEEYLRGRFYWNRRNEAAFRRALECFERSIAKDPGYAPAHAGLADAYITLAAYDHLAPAEAYPRAEASVARALELDDALAEAYVSLAALRMDSAWDWDGAEAAFRKALALDSGNASVYHWFGDLLSARGRADEAIAAARRARELDPLSLIVSTGLGIQLFYARRYEEAAAQQRRTIELDPTFAPAFRSLGGALEQLGRYDEAIEAYERSSALLPGELASRALIAHAYAVSGREKEAREILAALSEEGSRRYVASYSLAAIHVGLEETDRALERLEEAHRARDRGMVWLKVSPRLDPLRGHPRFQDLLRRMRLD